MSWDYVQDISPEGFGLFFVHVWAIEGTEPLDVTFFRDIPAIVEQMDWADPFGPAYATIRFPQCTGFDGPWVDPETKLIPSQTWWLRENVNVDISWIPATTDQWHVGEQMIVNPLTQQKTLYLHDKQQDGTAQPNIWEGFFVSLSPTYEGVSVQCQGALFQLDRYYAKPLNPMFPRSVEGMMCRYFDRRRRGIYTHDLVIPELSDPGWHILYDGLVDRGQGDKVPAEDLGGRYIPVDLTTNTVDTWINPNSTAHVKNNRWTGFLTRYSGNASWEKILTGYIMGQLSYMYVLPAQPQTTSVITYTYIASGVISYTVEGDLPAVGDIFVVSGLGGVYDGSKVCTEVVDQYVFTNYKKDIGYYETTAVGAMSFNSGDKDIPEAYKRGDQWTITMDPGRIPRMYVRKQNAPATLVAWYGQPGIEAILNRDGNQVVNAFYGSGKGANAGGDFTWTRQFSPGDVPWQTFRPIATDPDVPIYHYWEYLPGEEINPPASDVYPFEPWKIKREDGDDWFVPTILDLPDGYDAAYERLNGIWVSEKYVQFTDGVDEGTAREVTKAWIQMDRDPGWAGDITVKVDLRDPEGGIRSKWSIRDGDIIVLKGFQGTGDDEVRGTNVFHVTGVTMNPMEGSVTLKVDTKFRDLLSVEEAIARGKDSLVPINSLQVGKRSAMIDDMIVPWNNSRGSGYIPRTAHTTFFNSPFPHIDFDVDGNSTTGDSTMYPPTGDPVRGEMFTSGYRGKGKGWPVGMAGAYFWQLENKKANYHSEGPVVNPAYDGEALYVPVNAGNPNKSRRWACIPVLLSQAGQIVRTELAAYDKHGKLAPIEFHASFYTIASTGVHSMPANPADGDFDDEGTPHSALWDGAFESYDRRTGYYFAPVTAHTGYEQPIIGWGGFEQPAGYSPKRKIAGAAGDRPTGMLMDSSPWSYNFFGDATNARFPNTDPGYDQNDESMMSSVSVTLCIYAQIPESLTDEERDFYNWVYFRGRVYKGSAG